MQRSCEDLWLPHRVEGGGEDRNLDRDGVGDQDHDGDGDDGDDGDDDYEDSDQVTAITILTFGTSQIDLFASKVGSFINYVALCSSKVPLLHLHFDLFCLISHHPFLLLLHQIAAISDPEADGSIGNVVAANAIGVFLGVF